MDASMVEVAERVPVFAEAQMLARSTANPMELRVRTEAYLKAGHATFTDGPVNFQQEPYLSQHLSSLHICDLQLSGQDVPSVAAWQAELNVRVYQLSSEGAADETEGEVTSCQIWMLPATVLMCSKHAFVPVGSSCVHMCLLCCSGHHALRTCVLGRNFTGFGTL